MTNDTPECAREEIKIQPIEQEVVSESTDAIASPKNEPKYNPSEDCSSKTTDDEEPVKIMDYEKF